jgi:hypothetical protein
VFYRDIYIKAFMDLEVTEGTTQVKVKANEVSLFLLLLTFTILIRLYFGYFNELLLENKK